MAYNQNNIFAKIIRGEIPCQKVYEDQEILAFHDINPKAKTHVLIVPKAAYISWDDFAMQATSSQTAALMKAIPIVARKLGLEKQGYRIIANHGHHAHQEVPHFHLHLLGGNPLRPLVQS